ncbi:MAG TPA: DUF5832 domain-containing protein [Allocoleopsis sp.]
MFKFRGAFGSYSDCEDKVKILQVEEPDVNIYICESFKWGYLLPDSELLDDRFDVEYREGLLNKLMSQYKESRVKAREEFENRQRIMFSKAKFDSSKEGQELLSRQKKNAYILKQTVESLAHEIKELESRQEEANEKLHVLQKELEFYTPEQIEEAKKQVESSHSSLFDEEDIFTKRKLELLESSK